MLRSGNVLLSGCPVHVVALVDSRTQERVEREYRHTNTIVLIIGTQKGTSGNPCFLKSNPLKPTTSNPEYFGQNATS